MEQLSNLALNVRKQTSPESRRRSQYAQPHMPEVHLTLVDKSSEEEVRNPEPDQQSSSPSLKHYDDQNSKSDSPDLMVLEQSAEYAPGLSTIQEVVPSGTCTFTITVQPTGTLCSSRVEDENATRLIDDNSNLSPESVTKQLNPYQQSTERCSSVRLGS